MFKVTDTGSMLVTTDAETGRVVRRDLSKKVAADALAFLNKEAETGRKPGSCSEGLYCDANRVHMPEMLTEAERASLRLCDVHRFKFFGK